MNHRRRVGVFCAGLGMLAGMWAGMLKSAQGQTRPAKHSEAWQKTTKALGQNLPRIEFADIELKDVLEFFQEVTDVKIRPDWAALKRIGVTRASMTNVLLRDVTLGRALELTLASMVGLGRIECVIGEDGAVHVHPAKAGLPAGPAKPTEKQLATRRKLAAKFPRADFGKAPLMDTVTFLRDVTDVNFFVDWPSLKRIKVGRDSKVTLKLTTVPVRDVLTAMLRAVSSDKALRWEVDAEGVVLIHALPPRPATQPAVRSKGSAAPVTGNK